MTRLLVAVAAALLLAGCTTPPADVTAPRWNQLGDLLENADRPVIGGARVSRCGGLC